MSNETIDFQPYSDRIVIHSSVIEEVSKYPNALDSIREYVINALISITNSIFEASVLTCKNENITWYDNDPELCPSSRIEETQRKILEYENSETISNSHVKTNPSFIQFSEFGFNIDSKKMIKGTKYQVNENNRLHEIELLENDSLKIKELYNE